MVKMGYLGYLVRLLDKIGEARFFLLKLESGPSSTEAGYAGYYMSAISSACYSFLMHLEEQCKEQCREQGLPEKHSAEQCKSEQHAWWARMNAALERNPAHVYFRRQRNRDIHGPRTPAQRRAPLPYVSGIEFSLAVSDQDDELFLSERPLVVKTKDYSPQSSAEACQDYLDTLVPLAVDAYSAFSSTWDPEGRLKAEFLRLRESTTGTAH